MTLLLFLINFLGYGDIVPITPFGYVIGGLCAMTGLVFLALPIPVIVNNFTNFYAHAKARQRLKEYSLKYSNLPNRAVALQLQFDSKVAFFNYFFNFLYFSLSKIRSLLKEINFRTEIIFIIILSTKYSSYNQQYRKLTNDFKLPVNY